MSIDIAQIVRLHTGDLLRGALGLGFPPSDAEELVQATFTTFLEAVKRFEGRSSIKTFLFGILYKKALEAGRRRREVPADPADDVFEKRFNAFGHWSPGPKGPEETAAISEVGGLIAQCLDALPEKERAAFCLKEIDREAGPDVCNILQISGTHLRVLLFRARTKLRACLEGKWGS